LADIKGTAGKDIYTVKKGDNYDALEGDDEISFEKGGTAQGGPGNDKITVPAGFTRWDAVVWYWSSTKPIYVDLEAGYALDGFGTRDTLINVHQVHGFKQDGDQGYGTSGDDAFWVGPWTWNYRKGQKGLILIDGRGGNDQVTIGLTPSQNEGDLVVKVSADARTVDAYHTNSPGFIYEFRNIETLNTWNNDTKVNKAYDLMLLVDVSKIGQETLLRTYKGWQSSAVGNPVTLTYSFLSQAPTTGGEGGVGFSTYSDAQKQIVRDLFLQLHNQTGLTFSEVAGDAGQIRLGINQQANTRAYSFIPDEFKGDARAGDVWLDQETAAVMNPGQEGYYVLLHELGHALGLQHPLTELDTSGATVLLNQFSTITNTVMLDVNASTNNGSWPAWFGSFDIQAFRYLYGSKAYATGDNVYKLAYTTGSLMILDDGGYDTLDASAVSLPATIDLRAGKSSSVGFDTDGTSAFNNVSIAAGTLIENVVGTAYDDVITCNSQNNVITFSSGNDIVDGGAGIDLLRIWRSSSDFNLSKNATSGFWNVDATNSILGHVELQNVERIYFSDTTVALDLGGTENAGMTAKIIGAVFGKSALSNKAYVGIGLSFLDAGWTYDNLAGLALNAAGAQTNDQIVSLLWKNIIGVTASDTDKAPYISFLKNGMTPGALAHLAADSSYNTNNINLVGLAATGLEYIPV